jgi:hypothetical protein
MWVPLPQRGILNDENDFLLCKNEGASPLTAASQVLLCVSVYVQNSQGKAPPLLCAALKLGAIFHNIKL